MTSFYQRSTDGINWITEQGEVYEPGISFHNDGYVEDWFQYERIKVFQDKHKRAVQINCAVIDTIKWEDLPNDNHSSKNICIPLQKDLLLTILNKKKISESTQQIKLKISAEPDFNTLTDINIESLRFGSYNEVNFGRGAKVIKHEKNGNDLIVVFDGRNSGITVDEIGRASCRERVLRLV